MSSTETIEELTPREIESAESARKFLLAGNSRFTLVSKATGRRFTYNIQKADKPGMYFASLLYGPDNTSNYKYFGFFFLPTQKGQMGWTYRHGKPGKACASRSTDSIKAFEYVIGNILERGRIPEQVELWHEGRCGRCSRVLTVPASIESGFGPECRGKIGV